MDQIKAIFETVKYILSLYKGPDKAFVAVLVFAVIFLSTSLIITISNSDKEIQKLQREKFESDHNCQLEQIKYLKEIIIEKDNTHAAWDSTLAEVKRALKKQ